MIHKPRVEKWMHKDAYESYVLLGPTRSTRELSKIVKWSKGTLDDWRKWFDWDAKIALRDEKVMTQVESDNDKIYLEKVKQRHQKAYQDVQDKAMKQIRKKKLSFDSDKDAAIALDIGIKGERDVLGLRNTNLKAAMAKEGFAAIVEMVSNS